MTFNMSSMGVCSMVQSLPILLIMAQKQQTCLETPLIYNPPQPTFAPLAYNEAVDVLLNAIESHTHAHDNHYGSYEDHGYQYGQGYQGHETSHSHGKPCAHDYEHEYGTPYYDPGHGSYRPKANTVKGQAGYTVSTKGQSEYPQVYAPGVQVYASRKGQSGYPRANGPGVKRISVSSKSQSGAPGTKVYSVSTKGQNVYPQTYAPGVKVYTVNTAKGPSGYPKTKEHPTTRPPVNKYKVVIKNRRREKLVQGRAGSENSCITIDGGVGSCISIRHCDLYLQILQTSQTDPNAINVLRRSHCGFDGNDPKVCCPPTQPIPTAPPVPFSTPETPPEVPDTPVEQPDGGDSSSDFVDALPDPPVCGYSNASFSRVVGGVDAKLGDFPWMALLGYKSKRNPGQARWLCGGSLVTAKHVLTAAHCIHGHEDDLYQVRLGELDISKDDEGATPIDVPIKQKTKHEHYSAKSFSNDIGILLLSWPVQFTFLIRPICLPMLPQLRAQTFERYTPIIAGWGDTEFHGPAATHLQALQLPVVSNAFCATAYSAYKAQVIDERVLCAGYEKGGRDACQGDSGGPLMLPHWNSQTYNTYFYQIGVVSYGRKCAEAGFPGVYSRTTHFMPWLHQQLVGSPMR